MKIAVTGAAGFLGRSVVAEAARRGHRVTALARRVPADAAHPSVQWIQADLRRSQDYAGALSGVDALIHLAAVVYGDDDARIAGTLTATEGVIEAVNQSKIPCVVLASSFSVYRYPWVLFGLDEHSPMDPEPFKRDAYALAKIRQEELMRDASRHYGWSLTVLRPGFIWAPGQEPVSGCGLSIGPFYGVIGPARRLPLTRVDRCAGAFVRAAETPGPSGRTFNVVDDPSPFNWSYAGQALASTSGRKLRRIPVPYVLAYAFVCAVYGALRLIVPRNQELKLPSFFYPVRFRARFCPARASAKKIREALGHER